MTDCLVTTGAAGRRNPAAQSSGSKASEAAASGIALARSACLRAPAPLRSRRAQLITGLASLLLIPTLLLCTANAVAAPSTGPANRPTGIDALLSSSRNQSGGDDFLPPDEAFRLEVIPQGSDRVLLNWAIADGYYLYRARVKVSTSSDRAQLGSLQMPPGKIKNDEYFGKQEIYHSELAATLPVTHAANAELELPLQVTYQGCADAGLCYPPITKTIKVTLPSAAAGGVSGPSAGGGVAGTGMGTGTVGNGVGANGLAAGASPGAAMASGSNPGAGPSAAGGPSTAAAAAGFVSEQDRLAALIRSGNLMLVLGTFFGLGVLLAFTPCVLPMVPILSGIIAGHGKNVTTARAFSLSLVYVLGMAITYTTAGILFAAAGKQAQAVFQQPWIVVLFAALFVALALSMFGVFTVQMPAAIQSRVADLSNRQSAGTFGGVAVMGALSALIVTTCVAPPLVATLIVIGQSGNLVRGGAALFAMSMGMGAPLLAVGASAGKLLPKVGPWMDTVKKFFGVIMLGVAAWMLARILPDRLSLTLWAVPALVAAALLWSQNSKKSAAMWVVRTAGAAAGLYGMALLAGAALGGTDPLAPIPALASKHRELPFRVIKSVADLDREVTEAKAQGRTVLVDFYADWCTSCKEMEKYTFTDTDVQAALDRTVLLRANVTQNDADDQALLRRFGIFGPPTIAFYGLDGQERPNYRVVGYMKADAFATRARQALQSSAGSDQHAMRDGGTGHDTREVSETSNEHAVAKPSPSTL